MNRNTLLSVLLACAFVAHPAMAVDNAEAARPQSTRNQAPAHVVPAPPIAVAEAMQNFLDRTGLPMLAVDLQCNAGKAVIAVQQNSHLPSSMTAESAHSWNVPSCIHYV
jgi:hypothetical protein